MVLTPGEEEEDNLALQRIKFGLTAAGLVSRTVVRGMRITTSGGFVVVPPVAVDDRVDTTGIFDSTIGDDRTGDGGSLLTVVAGRKIFVPILATATGVVVVVVVGGGGVDLKNSMRPFSTQMFAGGGGGRPAIEFGLLTSEGIADFTNEGELGADKVQLANRPDPPAA